MATSQAAPKPSSFAWRLVRDRLLSEEQARNAHREALERRQSLVQYLVEEAHLNSGHIALAAADEFGAPVLDLDAVDLADLPLNLVDEKLVSKHRALPIFQRGNRLSLGVSDPTNHHALDEIGFATGLATNMVLVEEAKLATAIEQVIAARDRARLDILNTDLEGLDIAAEGAVQRYDSEPNVDDAPIVRYIDKVLIATYKEKTESIKGKLKKALVYPVAVILVAIVVTAAIMLFVIPQFEALFTSFGADLPTFTRLVIAISDFLRQWWWGILLVLVALYFVTKTGWKRSSGLREILHRLGLKLPLVRPILHQAAIARFARTLSTTFAAGVPLVEALGSVAGATGNLVYSRMVMQMREEVAAGQALQFSMHRRNLFPHLVVRMTAVGEESGALEDMLAKVADFYEEAVDNAVDGFSSLLEPMIMIVIGILVGGLVIAMYLPVFKLAAVV